MHHMNKTTALCIALAAATSCKPETVTLGVKKHDEKAKTQRKEKASTKQAETQFDASGARAGAEIWLFEKANELALLAQTSLKDCEVIVDSAGAPSDLEVLLTSAVKVLKGRWKFTSMQVSLMLHRKHANCEV